MKKVSLLCLTTIAFNLFFLNFSFATIQVVEAAKALDVELVKSLLPYQSIEASEFLEIVDSFTAYNKSINDQMIALLKNPPPQKSITPELFATLGRLLEAAVNFLDIPLATLALQYGAHAEPMLIAKLQTQVPVVSSVKDRQIELMQILIAKVKQ